MDDTRSPAPRDRLYTAEQVRRLDRCAIEEHGIAGEELMERAGKAAFDAARGRFPGARKWLVACGGGNNGGDGYVIARLARAEGIDISLHALRPVEQLSGDALAAAHRWRDVGGGAENGPPADLSGCDLVIDALLGTGIDRPASGDYARCIEAINASQAAVVAVDIPSGLDADTGRAMGGMAVAAGLTVTFIGHKRGLFTADGPDFSGEVQFAGLEVPHGVHDSEPDSGILVQENIISLSLARRRRNSHKGDFGWLLGIGGDQGMSGALRLCGEGALRAGAGKVTLLTHPAHAEVLNIGRPELMVRGVEDGEALAAILDSADAVALGPGLGQSGWSRSILEACRNLERPRVLDADALNLLAAEADLGAYFRAGPAVITPHPAEAGRLLGISAGAVQDDRVTAAQELARRSGAVVVLKGCGTVIAGPAGHYGICPLGNPGMASGGTGDVLAGIIGALLAQGLDAWHAAAAGVAAHAAAGDRAAAAVGERGMLASDLADRLPAVLNPR